MKQGVTTAIIIIISTLLSLTVIVALFEAYLDHEYEVWRSNFSAQGDWQEGLTTVSENPKLKWEYKPNSEGRYAPGQPKVKTNKYGFRSHDSDSIAKPDDLYRIAFIGDSVTMGHGVDGESTFVSKLSAYSEEKYPDAKIQTMNFGIAGYDITQISELLTSKVLQFKPDKIVYTICLNDFDLGIHASRGLLRYFNKPENFLLERLEKLHMKVSGTDYHLWHYNKNKQVFFDKIVEMQNILSSKNTDFQIVIMPIFKFDGAKNSFASYPLDSMHNAIGDFLERNNLSYIDLLDDFMGQSKSPWFYASGSLWHPNIAGHDFIARTLANKISIN